MATISTHLRNFKEPTKDQLTELFFALPASATGANLNGMNAGPSSGPGSGAAATTTAGGSGGEKGAGGPETELEKMEINAVLSLGVQGEEDSYVSASSEYATPSSMPYLTGPAIMCDALLAMFDRFHVQEKARVLLSALLMNVATYCDCRVELLNEPSVYRQASYTSSRPISRLRP